MRHLALFRWIRGLLPACIIILLLLVTSALILITTVGIPTPLIRAVERELAKQEVFVRIDKIRVEFLDGFGFVARNIEVFDKKPAREGEPLVMVSRVKLDISMDSLFKGEVGVKDLKSVEVKGIFVSLPLKKDGKETTLRVEMKDLNGAVLFPTPGLADFSRFSWEFEGIRFSVQGRLRFPLPNKQERIQKREAMTQEDRENATAKRQDSVKELVNILEYIHSVKLPKEKKPTVSVNFDFNTSDLVSGRAFLSVRSPYIETRGYRFRDVNLDVAYQSGTISVENFSFRDRNGEFRWGGSYLLKNRSVVGRLKTNILWNPVIKAFLPDTKLPMGLKLTQGIGVSADMRMTLNEKTYIPETYQVTGDLSSRNFQMSGVDVKSISADFSVQNDKYFLDNVRLMLTDSELTGRFLYADDLVRTRFSSNIPLEIYLKLAREWGSAVKIPEGVTISGIPDINVEARIKLPSDKDGSPVVDASASVKCRDIAYKDVKFSKISLDAVYRNGEGSIPELIAQTEDGREFSCSGSYFDDLLTFKVKSDLPLNDWFTLISEWKESVTLPEELVISGIPEVEVEGKIKGLATRDKPLDIQNVRASLNLENISYRDVKFKTFALSGNYESGNIFLPNLSATMEDGRGVTVSGEMVDDQLAVNLKSTLLIGVLYKMIRDPNVQMHSDVMLYGKNGKLLCEATFKTNIKDFWNFEVTGSASTSDLTYNGVPVESGSTSFRYIPHILTLSDSKLVFPYTSYDMAGKERQTPRPTRGVMTLKKLVNYEKNSTLELIGLEANAYPEPVMQMFAPHIVPVLSQFRFHEVPYITGGGMIDIMDPNLSHTDLKLKFSTKGRVDYDFLKKTLKMSNASGRITIRREKFYLDDFQTNIWGGKGQGKIGAYISNKEGYDGSLKFINCNLKHVGATFGGKFEDAFTNANIDFSMMGSKTKDLKAGGRIELTEGNLLSIPFFGPLSTVFDDVFGFVPGVGGLVGSRINQASCDYYIDKGDFITKDFVATGNNMKITGIATVNLDKVSLNMSIRVDFKSLIGLILKPISIPFGGLFEFRGEGPLENPSWYPTPFSGAYSEGQKK